MGCKQFTRSIRSILGNSHIHRGKALAKHLHWQYLKVFGRFPFEQKLSRSRIMASRKSCGVSALIHSQGLYDYDNMMFFQALLQNGGVFFDVGANIGAYTLLASESAKAVVYAFEPHPATFAMLKVNVELNHRENITLYNLALGQTESTVLLTNDPGGPENHIVPAGINTVAVRCVRADSCAPRPGFCPTTSRSTLKASNTRCYADLASG